MSDSWSFVSKSEWWLDEPCRSPVARLNLGSAEAERLSESRLSACLGKAFRFDDCSLSCFVDALQRMRLVIMSETWTETTATSAFISETRRSLSHLGVVWVLDRLSALAAIQHVLLRGCERHGHSDWVSVCYEWSTFIVNTFDYSRFSYPEGILLTLLSNTLRKLKRSSCACECSPATPETAWSDSVSLESDSSRYEVSLKGMDLDKMLESVSTALPDCDEPYYAWTIDLSVKPTEKVKRTSSGKRLCQHPGCTKVAQIGPNIRCVRHGGGRRCSEPFCNKGATGNTMRCIRHGGGNRCNFQGCGKGACGKSDFCKRHIAVMCNEFDCLQKCQAILEQRGLN